MEVLLTDLTMEFNFASDIVARREARALYKPFQLENGSFAVFVKGPNQELVRVEFDKSQASSDPNSLGPKYLPTYWATKLAQAAIEEPNPQKMSLNDIANYYLDLKGPRNPEEWDGKFIFDRNEIFNEMPAVKNAIPSFTVQTVTSKGDKEWFPDSAPNKVAYDALKKQQTPFSRLPTATAPNKL